MTRFAQLRDSIGWDDGAIADRLGVNLRTVQRWASGRNEAPANVTAWLEMLARYHLTHARPAGWSGAA